MTLTATLLLLTWMALIVLGFALAGLLSRVHRLEQQVAGAAPAPAGAGAGGPPVGVTAPSVPGLDLEGGAVLLFADRECGSCRRVLPAVAAAAGPGRPVHVLWSGPRPTTVDDATGVVHHDEAGAAYAAFGVRAAPWLVAVDAAGTTAASGAAGSEDRALALLDAVGPTDAGEADR